MPSFESKVMIERPPEVVAEAFLNPDNAPYWNSDLKRFEVVELGPGLAGSRARLHYRQGNRTYVMEDYLEQVVPNQYFKSRVTGNGIRAIVQTWLRPVKEGTEVSMRWSGRGTSLLTFIVLPFMKRAISRQVEQELATFKNLVEAHGAQFSPDAINDQDPALS
ncbi:MAG: SRPBCC family protein [Anaerolineales bacterium]|jgi:hypothetical protein